MKKRTEEMRHLDGSGLKIIGNFIDGCERGNIGIATGRNLAAPPHLAGFVCL